MPQIGEVYKSYLHPESDFRVIVNDISECGEIIKFHCMACDKLHELESWAFSELFYLAQGANPCKKN